MSESRSLLLLLFIEIKRFKKVFISRIYGTAYNLPTLVVCKFTEESFWFTIESLWIYTKTNNKNKLFYVI